MDQLIKGLETRGVCIMITSYPRLMRAHFVNSAGLLTSGDLIDNLSCTDITENQMAKDFLIRIRKRYVYSFFSKQKYVHVHCS